MSRLGRIALFAFGSAFLSFVLVAGLLLRRILAEEHGYDWSLWDSLGPEFHTVLSINAGMLIGGVASSSFGSSFPRSIRIIQLTVLTVVIALPIATMVGALLIIRPWYRFWDHLAFYFLWNLAPYGLVLLPTAMVWALVCTGVERRA
jgi:hypothetical protein